MSTRGSLGFRFENKDFLFRYFYDSFPAYLLKNLLVDFEAFNYNYEAIRIACKNLSSAEDKDFNNLFNHCLSAASDMDDVYLKDEIERASSIDDLQQIITHNIGIFPALLKYDFNKLKMDNDFIKYGLYCEYAYIFDLDNNSLEVYTGCPEISGSGRYIHNDSQNIGCHLAHKVSFETLKMMSREEKDIFCSHDIIYHTYNDRRKNILREKDIDLERRLHILEKVLTD